jgi:hypothetical protein
MPWLGLAETNVLRDERTSLRRTLSAVDGPAFTMVIV